MNMLSFKQIIPKQEKGKAVNYVKYADVEKKNHYYSA